MKDKVCLICHTAIDMNKEFCKFEHYAKKEIIKSKAYYHVECFRKRLTGSDTQEKLAKQGFALLKLAKEKMGIEDKQEVVMA